MLCPIDLVQLWSDVGDVTARERRPVLFLIKIEHLLNIGVMTSLGRLCIRLDGFKLLSLVSGSKTKCTKTKVSPSDLSPIHQIHVGLESPYLRCLRRPNDEIESSVLLLSCDRSRRYKVDHSQVQQSIWLSFCNNLRIIDVLPTGPGSTNWRKPHNIWLLLPKNLQYYLASF